MLKSNLSKRAGSGIQMRNYCVWNNETRLNSPTSGKNGIKDEFCKDNYNGIVKPWKGNSDIIDIRSSPSAFDPPKCLSGDCILYLQVNVNISVKTSTINRRADKSVISNFCNQLWYGHALNKLAFYAKPKPCVLHCS